MIGLTGQVGRRMVVAPVFLERAVTQVAPQNRRHAQLVGTLEGPGHLDQLRTALGRAEIDRSPDRDGPHVPRLLDRTEHHLIIGVRIADQLVMVELDDEGNPMCVPSRDGTQHAESRRYGVAASLDRQANDILRIEIKRIGCERGACRMFDALIDRKDRKVARAGQPAVSEQGLQATERTHVAVRPNPKPVDRIGRGRMDQSFADLPARQ